MADAVFVRIRQLRKIYPMGRQTVRALDGIDLDIPEGSFTVIMGPSGSGKSTLLYLLGGLDRPSSGSIEVRGRSLESLDENALAIYRRLSVGFIFQQFNLLPSMTALDNVSFPMLFAGVAVKARRQRALKLLEKVGLEKRWHHRPTELSGGQQQRVAIARALVQNPPMILADEPTGNLDTFSGYSIMQTLSELHKDGRTILVVTHDQRMTHFATQVVRLLDGRIVSEEEYEKFASLAIPTQAE
jgi:putative ABC transport system ATP-binding protein